MRILWFSNTPAAGDDFFSSKSTGGWLKSLDKAIQQAANNLVAGAEPQEAQNYGNWMDILDAANADDDDILGLNNLFNENNPNVEGAQNAEGQAGGVNQLAGGVANPQGAVSNFSLALAGSVRVINQ